MNTTTHISTNSMNKLTQKIVDIIANRKRTADQPKREKEGLELLLKNMNDLEEMRQQILTNSHKESELINRLNELNLTEVINLISAEIYVWENLWRRFNRDTLNIGVAGIARQGKSTKLQSLTGLTDNEIPSSDRLPCTSVQSNIYHIPEGDTYAKVYFYSATSFLNEVIAPYYKELGFADPPTTLNQFGQPLPPMPTNSPNPAKAESLYRHLRDDYHAHLDKYKSLLHAQEREVKITKEHIPEFVSQRYDAQGNNIYFNHLAVRKVEIFCRFPKVEVEKVGLVDMPGLGDTRLGDQERMIKALGQDVDFILFVRRPVLSGDLWGKKDIDLYDSAYQALQDRLSLDEWSFMVLNYDGHNQQQCQDLENTRISKGIRVQKCVTANCKNSDEANQVLEEVLNYLARNLGRLDRQYMDSCFRSLKNIKDRVNTELRKARQALAQYGESHLEYVNLKRQFIKDLYNKIEDLREQLRKEQNQPDPNFKAQVDIAIKKCREQPGIPKDEELQSWKNKDGIDGAYFNAIQQMRTKLLRHFHELEKGLKESLEHKKSLVADVLIKLGLGGISQNKGMIFIKDIAEELSANLISLKLGFEFLYTFDILYKGFIQGIVWEHLSNSLAPYTDKPLGTPNDLGTIKQRLKDVHKEAIDKCEKALNILAFSPTEIGRAMVEEFADHITRAEGVEDEWDVFLGTRRSQVWPQLKELEARHQVQKDWLNLVNDTELINQKIGSFQSF